MKTAWVGRLVGAICLLGPRVAQGGTGRFGEQGEVVIDQSFSVSASRHRDSTSDLGLRYAATSFQLAPSASYFIAPNVSLGLQLIYGRSYASFDRGTQTTSSNWGVAPSAGYAFDLGEHFAIWPRLAGEIGDTYAVVRPSIVGGETNTRSLMASAQVPVLWLPATHFFVGFGPQVTLVWSGPAFDELSAPKLYLSALTQIGGYFEL
jgi:hypothetical protein